MDPLATAGPTLRLLLDQLWPAESGAVVIAGGGAVPGGHRVVEEYAVVPRLRSAQFLVPLASRRAAAASLLRYNALRAPKTRAVRAVLGQGFRLGLGGLFDRIAVCVPSGGSATLVEHLAGALGRGPLCFGVGVRPLDPNSKPTLQLFTLDGVPVGYAKIGWNDATRALVANEAESIGALPALPSAHVPGVLYHGAWNGRLITVTAPLPPAVRGHRALDVPPPRELTDTFSGPPVRSALAASDFWKRLRAETSDPPGGQPGDDGDRTVVEALRAALDRIEAAHGHREIGFGRWHGDWVPWNLGVHRGTVQIWDWEHSSAQAPLGLDLLHWRFQVALVSRGLPLADAVTAVRRSSAEDSLLGDLYLLEMFVRTWRLRRGGGGWNPAIHPAQLAVLAEIGVEA
ncbi:hypothetical protein [Actinocorallia longicatena]|uniref:Aminoglycoside phosphotransferase domain-containing protein n=1 Tax=Actinocorallia longicatena TaxID=111803 RepID=A0ABP6Q1T6_9ACTN